MMRRMLIGRGGIGIVAGLIATVVLSFSALASSHEEGPLVGVASAGMASVGAVARACPVGRFVTDLRAHPANSGLPAPAMTVACSDTQVVVRTNGIPTFPFVAKTPNPLRVQDFTFRIPLTPVIARTPGALNLGAIGVAVDGLPMYGPFEAPAQGTADPLADGILDSCGGHTGPSGEYHVHATPACLPADLMATPDTVVGYALDGFPIMSPLLCADDDCATMVSVRSSYQQVSTDRMVWSRYGYVDGLGDLDRCNGMTGPDGEYRYYAVSTFPYFLGCYTGEVGTQSAKRPERRP